MIANRQTTRDERADEAPANEAERTVVEVVAVEVDRPWLCHPCNRVEVLILKKPITSVSV